MTPTSLTNSAWLTLLSRGATWRYLVDKCTGRYAKARGESRDVREIETALAGKHSRHNRTAAKQRCEVRLGELMFLHQMAHYVRPRNRRPGDMLLLVDVHQVGERSKIY